MYLTVPGGYCAVIWWEHRRVSSFNANERNALSITEKFHVILDRKSKEVPKIFLLKCDEVSHTNQNYYSSFFNYTTNAQKR
jgi:hypothetical protein